jgi:tetratricopeptide (TPR) repeat protein
MAKDALSLAWQDMRRRHFAMAIKRLEAKADIYEENFEYYLTLGIACLYVGDIGASSSYFQLARRIRLTDTRLLLGQAAIFLRRGDTARALQYYLEIKENDPMNKTADEAMEFIRVHGNYDTICRWVDTGKIEQFYPPLGANPDKIALVTIAALAFILGCVLTVMFFPRGQQVNGPRANLSALELSSDEKSDAKEKDLSTQSYKFVLSNKEINKRYNNALQFFQAHRDNAAQVEVNVILNSDASLSIKKKARLLMGYFEIPDFDSISDVPAFSDVAADPAVYLDCWVNWGGKVSNAVTYDDGSYSCDLLVGDENLSHYEGTVRVRFDAVPSVDVSKPLKLLGKIVLEDGAVCLKGRAVYQSVHN